MIGSRKQSQTQDEPRQNSMMRAKQNHHQRGKSQALKDAG